jgi:succinate-semialdehyde dehydrogenase / glutarate-semialdehyde dehydrogenase
VTVVVGTHSSPLAEALEYGLAGVNDATGYTHEMPFGGCEESGLGREGWQEGLEEYLESKSLMPHMPQLQDLFAVIT